MDVIVGFLYGLVGYVSIAMGCCILRGCPTEIRWEDQV